MGAPKKKTPKKTYSRPGQPTKYESRFCEMLVSHMAEGLSYESFASVVNTDDTTLDNWCKAHPEFFIAKREAFWKCLEFWERLALKGAKGGKVNPALVIFNMKCRFRKLFHDAPPTLSLETEGKAKLSLSYKIDDDSDDSPGI